jgi:hypothetical protein
MGVLEWVQAVQAVAKMKVGGPNSMRDNGSVLPDALQNRKHVDDDRTMR